MTYWIEDVHKPPIIRIGTHEAYRVILTKYLIPGLGHIKLQKLTSQHIQSFYGKQLQQGVSAGRIKDIHKVLHTALNHAKRIKIVGMNVSDGMELPRVKEHEMEPLSPEQAQLLIQKVQEHHLEALLMLALTTGVRKGELLGLRWQDIDLDKGVLHIRRTLGYLTRYGFVEGEPKTEKGKRKLMLPHVVIESLKRHRALQVEKRLRAGSTWINKELVFPNTKGGFMFPSTPNTQFNGFLREIGLPHIRFHDLRHSAATLLLGMGVPMKVIQEILGHSTFAITMDRYSHVLPSMQKEAMDKMDDMFRQQS